jgi:hypothetical protein
MAMIPLGASAKLPERGLVDLPITWNFGSRV